MILINIFQLLALLGVAQAGVVGRTNNSTKTPLGPVPSASSTDTHHAEVIIIGGGISGISVARTLIHEYNITSIILIEGRDELGGRAHTETLTGSDGKTLTVEKGCNWIQGPGKEPITALATKWNLTTAPTDYGDVVFFQGKAGVEGTEESGLRGSFLTEEEALVFTEGYDNFLDNVPGYSAYREANMLVDLSVRVATSIMDWIPVTPMQRLYEYWNIDFTFAQPPAACSFANAFGQEVGIEDSEDQFVTDQRGYKYIFVQEARELFGDNLDDSRLHLSTIVQDINYSDNSSIKVTTDKGEFIASKYVVSTMSLGVLQHQDVTWTPKLPDWKKEAIFTFNMATYQKIFMLFPTQFWGNEQFVLYGDPDVRGRFAAWQNINAPGLFPQNTSANVLMVTAVDDLARAYELYPDEQIQEEAMGVLREMYGDDIPEPEDIVVPRWNIEPLYRGSYSNWPLGVLDDHHENLRQPVGEGRVMFTGEAMSPEAFGYVQGAWSEGIATAKKIGECLTKGDCEEPTIYEALKTCPQTASSGAGADRRGVSRMAKRNGSPRKRQ